MSGRFVFTGLFFFALQWLCLQALLRGGFPEIHQIGLVQFRQKPDLTFAQWKYLESEKDEKPLFWLDWLPSKDCFLKWSEGEKAFAQKNYVQAQGFIRDAYNLLFQLEGLKNRPYSRDYLRLCPVFLEPQLKTRYGREILNGTEFFYLLKTQLLLLRLKSCLVLGQYHLLRPELVWVSGSLKDRQIKAILGSSTQDLLYPRPWKDVVEQACKETGVDEDFVYSVMREESHFNPMAKSTAGALGVMQVMPVTAKGILKSAKIKTLEEGQLFDPQINARLGVFFLASLIRQFDGFDPEIIASAYNAGPVPARRWKAEAKDTSFYHKVTYKETKDYIRRVLSSFDVYRVQSGRAMDTKFWISEELSR